MDLIIANPPNPGRNHTTLAVGHAATYDTADDWPFDDIHDPENIMTADTAQSAGKGPLRQTERRSKSTATRCAVSS